MSNKQAGKNGFKKGNTPWNKGLKLTSKQLENMGSANRGRYRELSTNWKGGKRKDKYGYIVINFDRPTGRKNVREHRYIMEQHLGRLLRKSEVVHHINGIKDDNRLENLELMERVRHNNRWEVVCPNCNCKFKC